VSNRFLECHFFFFFFFFGGGGVGFLICLESGCLFVS